MARRYDLLGEPKPPVFGRRQASDRKKERRKRKDLSPARIVKGFVLLLAFNAAVAFFIYGSNFHSFSTPTDALARPGIRTNMCYKVFAFIPDDWQTTTVCQISNTTPFLVMPGLVLVFLGRRLMLGAR
ncbi:MAG: hypothetical protein AAF543_24150 [Pseudomonadota bacterium]